MPTDTLTTSEKYTVDDIVPLEDFGRDHWSTLAYIETVIVEHTFFPVVCNPRMRHNRHHFRVLPRVDAAADNTVCMTPECGSRLSGSYIPNHDDWCCLQDMAEAGLLCLYGETELATADDLEPEAQLTLSALGLQLVQQLRQHKSAGGGFANFVPTLPQPAAS